MSTIKEIFITMRPRQWIKNLIVFAALAFSQNLNNQNMLIMVSLTFGLLCLASSAVYLINDIADREADRLHPEKKDRPLASGALSVGPAVAAVIILITISLVGAFYLRPQEPTMLIIFAGYIILNLVYSYYLKHIILLDAFSIAMGFVLRVVAGAEVIQVEISAWIVLCTILGSLFLAFSKRRHELSLPMEEALNHRPALAEYNTYFLDQMISVVTASTVMAYALWTMSPMVIDKFDTKKLPWTIPFVCYGIFRYMYLVHQKGEGGNPSKLFISDKPLAICVLLWMASVVTVLYFLA